MSTDPSILDLRLTILRAKTRAQDDVAGELPLIFIRLYFAGKKAGGLRIKNVGNDKRALAGISGQKRFILSEI